MERNVINCWSQSLCKLVHSANVSHMIALERNESFSRFHSARAGVNQWQTDWIIELHKNWRKGNAYTPFLTVADLRIIVLNIFKYHRRSRSIVSYHYHKLTAKWWLYFFSELYIDYYFTWHFTIRLIVSPKAPIRLWRQPLDAQPSKFEIGLMSSRMWKRQWTAHYQQFHVFRRKAWTLDLIPPRKPTLRKLLPSASHWICPWLLSAYPQWHWTWIQRTRLWKWFNQQLRKAQEDCHHDISCIYVGYEVLVNLSKFDCPYFSAINKLMQSYTGHFKIIAEVKLLQNSWTSVSRMSSIFFIWRNTAEDHDLERPLKQ